MDSFFNLRRLCWAVGTLACLPGTWVTPVCEAQALRIQDLIRTNAAVMVRYPSDTSRYYLLYRGNRIEQAFLPKDAKLGLAGFGFLRDNLPPSDQAYYRVIGVPLAQPVDTDGDGIDDVYELQTQGLNPLVAGDAQLLDPSGNGKTYLQVYKQLRVLPARIASSSPAPGETGVAVTRETILNFSEPLAAGATINTDSLYATFGGRKILSRVELSSDRRKATLFYLENLPASSRVRVTLKSNGFLDINGKELDPDGNGTIDFDTLNVAAVGITAVIGHVFASDPMKNGADGFVNRALAGVTITVDGAISMATLIPKTVLPGAGCGISAIGGLLSAGLQELTEASLRVYFGAAKYKGGCSVIPRSKANLSPHRVVPLEWDRTDRPDPPD